MSLPVCQTDSEKSFMISALPSSKAARHKSQSERCVIVPGAVRNVPVPAPHIPQSPVRVGPILAPPVE